jgi:hypothetical protein
MLFLLPLQGMLQTTRFCVDKALMTQYILYPLSKWICYFENDVELSGC